VLWYGQEGGYNAMVMDLLGQSLEDLFQYCGRRFSVKTVCMLGLQMVDRLEQLHCSDYIHRDMKPDNFLMGRGAVQSILHIIDFGLAKKYRDGATKAHMAYRDHKSLTGTARYASLNTHLGIEQARRDDMESLGFILVYFLKGKLPWQGLQGNVRDAKYTRIKEKKLNTSVRLLTQGLPEEFALFLEHCRKLKFAEQPDYSYLKGLFSGLLKKQGLQADGEFDWLLKKKGVNHLKLESQQQQLQ